MIRFLIDLYILVIIVDTVLSYLPQFRYERWVLFIRQISGYTLNPVRKTLNRMVPPTFPFDLSPLVVILGLKLFIALF